MADTPVLFASDIKHHLTLLSSGYEHWSVCSCGWESLVYKAKMPAQLAFGEHLADLGRSKDT